MIMIEVVCLLDRLLLLRGLVVGHLGNRRTSGVVSMVGHLEGVVAKLATVFAVELKE